MAESVFKNLGFNFDTAKFGDAQYLSPQAQNFLNSAPLTITSWQQDDIANNDTSSTNYYKNPLANVCTTISSNATLIYNFANTTPFDFASNTALITNSDNTIIAISAFKTHTDNISGVSVMTSNTDVIPGLDTATSVGNYLLRIVNKTDGISNTTPMLGSMTSLFVSEEVNANAASIYQDYLTLTTSVAPNGNCYISTTEVNAINARLQVFNDFLNYRRISDWNFYANSNIIVLNSIKMEKFNNIGNTQNYLIQNLIGTDRLKNDLANTANTSS
jgi:hypothetical protein